MYLTDRGWIKDDETGCLRDPVDILNYCHKVSWLWHVVVELFLCLYSWTILIRSWWIITIKLSTCFSSTLRIVVIHCQTVSVLNVEISCVYQYKEISWWIDFKVTDVLCREYLVFNFKVIRISINWEKGRVIAKIETSARHTTAAKQYLLDACACPTQWTTHTHTHIPF